MNINVMSHDELDAVALSNDERVGEQMLNAVYGFLGRFVSYPSEQARVAHALWIVHTHLMDKWDSTPRIAFLSAEPSSGKSRALEVTSLLVPRPMQSVNMSTSALFRSMACEDGLPTILFDEIDTVFGPKAKENEEIRGLLNAGHRRGQKAYRSVIRGNTVGVEAIEAFGALAVAGLGWLPDTILLRSVIIRMRRRAPGERVEPFRYRLHESKGFTIREQIAHWATTVNDIKWPELPKGIEDRDVHWSRNLRNEIRALGFDCWPILRKLHALNESPWSDLKGKPLNDRGLAQRLRQYEIKPKVLGGGSHRGYRREDLHDAWDRYLAPPPLSDGSVTSVTGVTDQPFQQPSPVADVTDVTDVTHVAANGGEPDPDDWSFNAEPEDELSIPQCLRRM